MVIFSKYLCLLWEDCLLKIIKYYRYYSEVMFLSLFLFNQVKEKTLVEALTQKRATAGDETVVMNYKMHDVS